METETSRKLPIGIQSFEKLRREGFLYVDKTALVYRLIKDGVPYFLSRPRRFGKSLLLSTFKAYFEGRKDLFEGLAIEGLEKDWTVRPVLHLSLNAEYYESRSKLEKILDKQLSEWERLYGSDPAGRSVSLRFMGVIRRASEMSGKRVAVLIDEYDKPLLRNLHNEVLLNEFREVLTAFYTVLKDADEWLQFVFITGVTKFAQVGIFSNLNQLMDISFDPRYGTLCGWTREEVEAAFRPELEKLAADNGMEYAATMDELARMYDGYRFNEDQTEGMFNPFSVLKALATGKYHDYWFASGTPTFLAEMLKKTHYDLRKLEGAEVSASSLFNNRADIDNPLPMIYQSGYLTIKKYDKRFRSYTLGYPNEEVRYGLLGFAVPFYTHISGDDTTFYIGMFTQELEEGNAEAFLTRLRAFFADFPYELNDKTERHYQVVFYLVFKLMGQFVDAEMHSARGRADAVVKTSEYIYVFEFKLTENATPEDAIRQIDERGYLVPYSADGRRLVKVGVSFSAEERNLDRWIIEEVGR